MVMRSSVDWAADHAFPKKLRVNDGRRQRLRFPLAMPAEFVFQGRRSSALTSNVGSGGVHILTNDVLPVGKTIHLFIEWPAMLNGRCPLTLFVLGRILRRDKHGAAIRISRYEFRLRAEKRPKRTHL